MDTMLIQLGVPAALILVAIFAIGIIFVIIGSSVVPTSRRIPGRSFDVWGALLFMVASGLMVGLAIAFIGLAYHHEKRERERLRELGHAPGTRAMS